MKVACFIPIKENSERVPGKNLRELCGKPLYTYIIDHSIQADCFDDIYVDTNSERVRDYCKKNGVQVIKRKEELAKNTANGNDLLNFHYSIHPEYDFYFQLFATAPFLQPKSIKDSVNVLLNSPMYDSVFTALYEQSFYWYGGNPVNYRPCILPRSQDMQPVIEETTGLYGITRKSLERFHCRVGAFPYMCQVGKFEAVDINTEEDFKLAEFIGRSYWNY